MQAHFDTNVTLCAQLRENAAVDILWAVKGLFWVVGAGVSAGGGGRLQEVCKTSSQMFYKFLFHSIKSRSISSPI